MFQVPFYRSIGRWHHLGTRLRKMSAFLLHVILVMMNDGVHIYQVISERLTFESQDVENNSAL